MSYIYIKLSLGISIPEKDFYKSLIPYFHNIIKEENKDYASEIDEDNWFYFQRDVLSYFDEYYGIVCNRGEYHKEYTIGIEKQYEDSSIRELQDFNFKIDEDSIDLSIKEKESVLKTLIKLTGLDIKIEDLAYRVSIYS